MVEVRRIFLKEELMDYYELYEGEKSGRGTAKVWGLLEGLSCHPLRFQRLRVEPVWRGSHFVSGVLSRYKGDVEKAGGLMGLEVRRGSIWRYIFGNMRIVEIK